MTRFEEAMFAPYCYPNTIARGKVHTRNRKGGCNTYLVGVEIDSVMMMIKRVVLMVCEGDGWKGEW